MKGRENMKKTLSLLLALVLMLSLSVTAFANAEVGNVYGGTTELYTIVPEATYTLVIPSVVEIPYRETDYLVAEPYVVDVVNFGPNDRVELNTTWTDLVCGDNVIPMDIKMDLYDGDKIIHDHVNPDTFTEPCYRHNDPDWPDASKVNFQLQYYSVISADAWNDAVPGQYFATLTFESEYVRLVVE